MARNSTNGDDVLPLDDWMWTEECSFSVDELNGCRRFWNSNFDTGTTFYWRRIF